MSALPKNTRNPTSEQLRARYAARGADPFRGFKPFLKALGILQRRDPDVQAIIVGDRKVYYGAGYGSDRHFHEVSVTAKIDKDRTHFTGRLPYDDYRRVLQVSAAHVYLTVPFVLSWSCLEALATGCAVIGSDTAPVREFVDHGENGLLANFFDPKAIADQVTAALAGGPTISEMRNRARERIVEKWSLDTAITHHESLLAKLGLSTGANGFSLRLRKKLGEEKTAIQPRKSP